MIGKAYVSVFQCYNRYTRRMDFKQRPVLVIGQADSDDYIVLPISRVTNQANIDGHYDVSIDPVDVPLMNLTQLSYIRTHKQSVVHLKELVKQIVDFRKEYEDIYIDVISKMEEFQKNIVTNAL